MSLEHFRADQKAALSAQLGRKELEAERRRRLMRGSLYEFVKGAWDVIEPGDSFQPNWHVELICQALEDITFERNNKLLINIPPRFLKSITVSVCWPAWTWLVRPSFRFLFASYGHDLALSDSKKCRDIIESDWYQDLIPPDEHGKKWTLDPEENAKGKFANTKRGFRQSTSVGGAGTGLGANCFRGDTKVATEIGPIEIARLHRMPHPPRVWSFNHASGRPELQRVVASRVIAGRPIGVLRTGYGTELFCTDEHRVFAAGRGYVRASDLRQGDSLVACRSFQVRGVSEGDGSTALRGAQATGEASAPVLLSKLRLEHGTAAQEPRGHLPDVREGPWVGQGSRGGEVLFGGMHPVEEAAPDRHLSDVQAVVQSEAHDNGLLLERLCGRGAFDSHDRDGQLEVRQQAVVRHVLQTDHSADPRAGRREVHGLRMRRLVEDDGERANSTKSRGASYRRGQVQQSAEQPDHALSSLPHDAPQVESDAVSIPFRDCGITDDVYDIQVEGNHNFFAEGVLVHNCIVIDDPMNVEEYPSAEALDKVIGWFTQRMSSRRNNLKTGAYVLIMQRVHENDLAGYLISKDKKNESNPAWKPYRKIVVPLLFDPKGACPGDPRTEEGELLQPGRFDAEAVEEMKISLGEYGFSAQYQQRPVPAGGGMFKVWNLRFWYDQTDSPPPPWIVPNRHGVLTACEQAPRPDRKTFEVCAQSWDCTFKELKDSDFVAGQVWGRKGSACYLLDQIHGRFSVTDTIAAVRRMTANYPYAMAKYVEDKANGPAVIQILSHEIFGLTAVNPKGGKEARAWACSPMVDAGNIWLPHPAQYPWVEALIKEMSSFPKGSYDDQVDAMTQCLLELHEQSIVHLAALTR